MIAVEVEYRPISFIPYVKRTEAKLPARWSELSREQFIAVPDLLGGTLPESKQIRIFLSVNRKIAGRMDSYQKYCILRNLKYITEPDTVDKFYIPEIRGLKAPGPRLFGVTWGAFVFGDTYFQDYLLGDKKALDKFIACFYVPKTGFNEKDIEKNAKHISNISPMLKQALAINYSLIRGWLAKSYPNCFQKSAEGKKQHKGAQWVDVHDRIVGDDIANEEKYVMKPVSTVLRYLNRSVKQYYKNGGTVHRSRRVF